jgi:N,N'-diacetyllegionaminate synthase
MKIYLGPKTISEDSKCFVVAEVAQSHDGSIGYAYSLIDAAAAAGVDAVKFQAHYASHESTLDEPFRVNFSTQDKTRYDYWKRMEFSESQWIKLKSYAESKNLVFLCTPFSEYAVDLLESIGILGWKIGSAEFEQKWLIDKILKTKKPIILSTGMSQPNNIDDVHDYLKSNDANFCFLHCISSYPSSLNEINPKLIIDLKAKYDIQIGLSDHSGLEWPSIYAIANGASIIEIHVRLSEFAFGPDTSSSLSIKQIKKIIEARDSFYLMTNSPKAKKINNINKIFSRSIALKTSLKKGSIIKKEMIVLKKPGTGIQEIDIDNIVGKVLLKNYDSKYLLTKSHIKGL